MAEHRGTDAGRGDAWTPLLDACSCSVGPFEPAILAAWRAALVAVHARVNASIADLRPAVHIPDPVPAGVHSLLTLAGARFGPYAKPKQVIAAAAAVEFARRAVLQHAGVREDGPNLRSSNKEHVLSGDWSITQAARLVADIGPVAYRVLVCGWGDAQVIRLRTGHRVGDDVLFDTAIRLGAIAGGVPSDRLASPRDVSMTARMRAWAASL